MTRQAAGVNSRTGLQINTGRHQLLLHSALVLFKLGWLPGCLSDSTQTAATATALGTIFDALGCLATELQDYDQAILDAMAAVCCKAGVTITSQSELGAATDFADQNMVVSLMALGLLLQLLPVVVMRKTQEANACLELMSALMMKSRPATYLALAKRLAEPGQFTSFVAFIHNAC